MNSNAVKNKLTLYRSTNYVSWTTMFYDNLACLNSKFSTQAPDYYDISSSAKVTKEETIHCLRPVNKDPYRMQKLKNS